jgi:hypothetical protein
MCRDYPDKQQTTEAAVVYVISLDARDRLGEPPGAWRSDADEDRPDESDVQPPVDI